MNIGVIFAGGCGTRMKYKIKAKTIFGFEWKTYNHLYYRIV